MSWSNGAGGQVPYDEQYASTTNNGEEHEYDSYGFSLPTAGSAAITGFEVQILGYGTGGDVSVQVALSWDGGSTLDKVGGDTSPWVVQLSEGSPSSQTLDSVWIDNKPFSHTFTPSEVNSNAFTVWVKANLGAGETLYVDAVQVRVTYYDDPAGTGNPNNPTVLSTTHSTGVWYNAEPDVTLQWLSATDNPVCGSGIEKYFIGWDTTADTVLGLTDPSILEGNPLEYEATMGNGSNYFHVRSRDNVGNLATSTAHVGPYQYDEVWPTNPTVSSTRASGWLNSSLVPIALSGGSDTDSGIDGYAIEWNHSGAWNPDGQIDKQEGWSGETFDLEDGYWNFHLITADNAGNWAAGGTEYRTAGWYGVDTHAPTDPTLSSPTHAEGSRSNNPSVQIGVDNDASDPQWGEFGYEVSSGVDGFSVAWDGNPAGVPDTTKDHEESWLGDTYTLADGTWYFHLRTKDVAGNWTSTEDYGPITIDTVGPSVLSVTASPTQIADATATPAPGVDAFDVTIVFNETMSIGVTPSLTFAPNVAGGDEPTLSNGSGAWSPTTLPNDTFTMTYDVADQNLDVNSVTIDVTGAQDAAGNPQQDYTAAPEFDIDTLNPTVSVNIVDTALYDGDNASNVTFTFSESTLNFVFGDLATVGGAISGFAGSGTSYSATFTAADDFDETGSVSVAAGSYTDAAGNEGAAGSDTVDIDTRNPTVGLAVNDQAIYDGDVDADRFVVTATYSEAMNPAVDPTLTFTPNPSNTFTNPSHVWSGGNAIYTWTYDIEDAGVTVDDIDVGVSGGQDVAGNVQVPNTLIDHVDIDTENPIVSGTAIVNNTIATNDYVKNGDAVTITATVTDAKLTDGEMSYIKANLSDLGGESSVSPVTYAGGTATWNLPSVTCTPANGTVTVTVTAQDRSGNDQVAPSSDAILADNIDPVISDVLITNTSLTPPSTACVKNGQDVTVTATVTDANLESGDMAYITADLTHLGKGAAVNPASYNGSTAMWTLSGVTCDPADGTITVTIDAYDRAYNAATQGSDTITSDNTLPTITQISANPSSGCFQAGETIDVTVHFSEPVTLAAGGSLTVNLDSSGTATATIAPFTWQTSATGTYTVGGGEDSCDLSATSLTLSGTLRDCPWNDTDLTSGPLDPVPNNQNIDDFSVDKDVIVDTTAPDIVFNGFFDNWACTIPHTTPTTTEYWVDADCDTIVYFQATVTDNCSIPSQFIEGGVTNGVNVEAVLSCESPTGEHLTFVESTDVTLTPNNATHPTQIIVRGRALIRCLPTCPRADYPIPPDGCEVEVRINIDAVDCADNEDAGMTPAIATVVDEDPSVKDPTPRDDPRQDVYEGDRPDLEVRLDDFNVFRLMIREDTPDRIDVLWNDDDNCTGKSGGAPCCGTLKIESITVPPEYGTASIEIWEGTCTSTPQIRYAPGSGYIGPDQFKYRIADRCGNISIEATVYVQVIEEVRMEDVPVLACANEPTAFIISATDLWVDVVDPTRIPFSFAILDGPQHGIVTGDLFDIFYTPPSEVLDPTGGMGSVPSLDFMEGAEISLVYIPSGGFVGRDRVRFEFADPFGGRSVAIADVVVGECIGSGVALGVIQGEQLRLLVPLTFESILDAAWASVTLQHLADGTTYPGALSAIWDEDVGRYVLILDTETVPPGTYELTVPLGNGETVVLTVEVGEGA